MSCSAHYGSDLLLTSSRMWSYLLNLICSLEISLVDSNPSTNKVKLYLNFQDQWRWPYQPSNAFQVSITIHWKFLLLSAFTSIVYVVNQAEWSRVRSSVVSLSINTTDFQYTIILFWLLCNWKYCVFKRHPVKTRPVGKIYCLIRKAAILCFHGDLSYE